MIVLQSLLLAALAPNPGSPAVSGDWPAWRGADGSGVSTETAWRSVGAAEPLWTRAVGMGYSSVAAMGGKVYTAGHNKEDGVDVVWCLDASSGEELWAHAHKADLNDKFHEGGTLSTPTLHGDTLFFLDSKARLFALNAKSGEERWAAELGKDRELVEPTWGFSASPLVAGDLLIVNVGRVLALDPSSGKVRWESADYGHAYSTPTAFVRGGKPLLAVFNGDGLAILDQASGKELAKQEWKTQYDVNAASPVLAGDDLFVSSGYNHGCALLSLQDEGLKVEWENNGMKNKMSGCVLVGDCLYGFDEAVLTCMDLTGKERWTERGLGNGALMAAGERLIVITGKGELIVAAASPEGFQPLSRAQVFDGQGVFWTMPVLADGRIYCRSNRGQLVCRDHRGSE